MEGRRCKYYELLYENKKLRPVETIPGIRGRGIKESDGGHGFNYDILLRTLANVTIYPQCK
jgi:hypothetical protein